MKEVKKRLRLIAWIFYDFANSSYSAVIASVVFPVYFVRHLAPSVETGDVWWGRAVALSMLLVALTSPFMGGIADLAGGKKRFLRIYTLSAILCIGGLVFSRPLGAVGGLLLFCLANFFVEGAFVFYNAFLPLIAERSHFGRVSGWGFAIGYVGSAISLYVSLQFLRLKGYEAVWLFVGVFFLLFSIPALILLPEPEGTMGIREAALHGWKRTVKRLREAFQKRDFKLFLLSYFFFRDAINTVILFSSIFAANTLGFREESLVRLYLLIQISAMGGSFLMSWPADLWGPKRVLLLCLLVWTGVCLWAYSVTPAGFWWLAIVGGVVLGSTQASSRALFSRFVPVGMEAEYFGLYGFVGKTSSVLGPILFSTTVAVTGSERIAALSMGALFLLGLLLLLPLRPPE